MSSSRTQARAWGEWHTIAGADAPAWTSGHASKPGQGTINSLAAAQEPLSSLDGSLFPLQATAWLPAVTLAATT